MIILANAQEKLNYVEVDRQSYQLYLDENWPELIQFSKEARLQGIDFFYLQVRTGVALYNQGEFRKAAKWFLKAYANDQSFDWLQVYVYNSLVSSGRQLEAYNYASSFSQAVKHQIGYKDTGITYVSYEAGYGFNDDFESLKTEAFSTQVGLGSDYGEGYFLKNYNFHSLNLSHLVAPKFLLNHNLTYIGINRETTIDWSGKTSADVGIKQYQYFFNPVWVIGKKLNISPSLNLIFGNSDVYAGRLNYNQTKSYALTKTNFSDFIFSMALWSDFGNLSPGVEVNAGTINDLGVAQLSAWFTYYPLSNTNLYLAPRVYFKSGSGINGLVYNAMGISGGAKLGPVYLNGQYLFGNMENFIESSGSVVSNFPGKSNRKLSGSIYFPLGMKFQFVFRYINQNVIEKYQVYTDGNKSNDLEYNYAKQTITGGISWNF
jgi:hypothetical protein